MNILLIIQIILVFAALMFVHELGHFIFAKRAGIFVREFSLGLGPKLFSYNKGETMYSLRLLPFGAYVRMAGEDPEITDIKTGQSLGIKLNSQGKVTDIFLKKDNHIKIKVDDIDFEHKLYIKGTDENQIEVYYQVTRDAIIHYDDKKSIQIAPWERQFGSKPIKDRFASVLAGPIFNIIMAVILFFTVAMMIGIPSDQIMLGKINDGSPAEQAGLKEGDTILGIDNVAFESYNDLITVIQNSPGKKLNLRITRNEVERMVSVIPEDVDGKGLIGVQILQVWKPATVMEASSSAVTKTASMTGLIMDGFRMILTGNVSMDDIAGPVGIMKITSDAAKEGMATLLNWAAILSLYLGIFNLLPIPALDGSRLLFLSLEGVRGKPIDPQKESMVHLIGFAFLMLLMIVITVNDVSRIFNF